MSNEDDIPTPEERAAEDKACIAKRVPGEPIIELTFAEMDYIENRYRRECEANGDEVDQQELDDYIAEFEMTPKIAALAIRADVMTAGKVVMHVDGEAGEIFVEFNGVKIARRGHPGTPEAKTWVPLVPNWRIRDNADLTELIVEQVFPDLTS